MKHIFRALTTVVSILAFAMLSVSGVCASPSPVALPDNNPIATALLSYTDGALHPAGAETPDASPYVLDVPQESAAYSTTTVSATPAVYTPARTANSALRTNALSPRTPASISLMLSTLTPIAGPNSNVTVTLSLVDTGDTTTGPGSSLFSFDTNIGISTTYLSFVGGFTATPGSPFTFNDAPPGTTASNLRVAYDVNLGSYVNATSGNPITLGSFVVHVAASGLPPAGTTITLGSPGTLVGAGGSEVINSTTFTNVLTGVTPVVIAPEPSGLVSLLAGLAGVSLLVWRKRSRAA